MHWTLLAPAIAIVTAAIELVPVLRAWRRGDEDSSSVTNGLAMATCTVGLGVISATIPVLAGIVIVALPIHALRDARRRRRYAELEAKQDQQRLLK